jgi:hypothetical protein
VGTGPQLVLAMLKVIAEDRLLSGEFTARLRGAPELLQHRFDYWPHVRLAAAIGAGTRSSQGFQGNIGLLAVRPGDGKLGPDFLDGPGLQHRAYLQIFRLQCKWRKPACE